MLKQDPDYRNKVLRGEIIIYSKSILTNPDHRYDAICALFREKAIEITQQETKASFAMPNLKVHSCLR